MNLNSFCPQDGLIIGLGGDVGRNRYCNANPVDLEGFRGQVLEVLCGFWWILKVGGQNISGHKTTPFPTKLLLAPPRHNGRTLIHETTPTLI